ncbi:adenylate kinase [Synechococcus sp. M16CYN]|uniref:adenylate kinase n=1 Tax=Synechococcus sp. M16CYN TaxID=3103139 RepID=UPI0030E2B1F5
MKTRLLLLGPPGAGKGTQATRLCDSNGINHLSMGDLLRSEVIAKSELGKQAEFVISQGELVSDELVLAIVEKQMRSISGEGWLLDGFPRTIPQAEALAPLLTELQQPIETVVLLQLNESMLIKRMLDRGRADDSEMVIRNRLRVYQTKTAPLINYYQERGLLVSVSAHGSVEEVTERITNMLS